MEPRDVGTAARQSPFKKTPNSCARALLIDPSDLIDSSRLDATFSSIRPNEKNKSINDLFVLKCEYMLNNIYNFEIGQFRILK